MIFFILNLTKPNKKINEISLTKIRQTEDGFQIWRHVYQALRQPSVPPQPPPPAPRPPCRDPLNAKQIVYGYMQKPVYLRTTAKCQVSFAKKFLLSHLEHLTRAEGTGGEVVPGQPSTTKNDENCRPHPWF